MRIAIGSDIHLEFGDYNIKNIQAADVLVLSGDITTTHRIGGHIEFFRKCSEQFNYTVYVLGNHEHYHGNFYDTHTLIKEQLRQFKNIFVLDCGSVYFDEWDVRFLGGTLWTDMNKENPVVLNRVKGIMSDFDVIDSFDPMTSVYAHQRCKNYIQEQIDLYREQGKTHKMVFVGHHAPSFESVHERYKRDFRSYDMNFCFASEMDEFILNNPEIVLWTHGHTHHPFDYNIGSTRIVCNPRGYVGYDLNPKYDLVYVEI